MSAGLTCGLRWAPSAGSPQPDPQNPANLLPPPGLCKRSSRPLQHRELIPAPQRELPAFVAPGATLGTAKGVAGLRGTGSYSRHRNGSCRPSRHQELLPAPVRKLLTFATPGATPGTAKGELPAFAAPGNVAPWVLWRPACLSERQFARRQRHGPMRNLRLEQQTSGRP